MLKDRIFYSVEEWRYDGKILKQVHIFGNLFKYDMDNELNPRDYEHHEYCGLFVDIDELHEMLNDNKEYGDFDDFMNENVRYAGGYSTEEAFEMAENYFSTTSVTSLSLWEVSKDTPCGDYYWERD